MSIRVLFCGDFVAQNPKNVVFEEKIKEIINNSDLRIVNFEAPIKVHNDAFKKSGPTISQSRESVNFLEDLGFNAVSFSNNHIFDYGLSGFNHTKSLFKKAKTMGAGNWDEAYSINSFVIKNTKIGILALCHREFYVLDNEFDDEQISGCAWINHQKAMDAIISNRKDYDFLFVYAHAGVEDIDIPLPEWRIKYRQFIDAGADAVIASHPHIIQGFEKHCGKYIFYSLGNFFFEYEVKHEHWKRGLLVTLNIENNIITPEIFYVKRINCMLQLDTSPQCNIEQLNLILNDTILYNKHLNHKIEELLPMYLKYLERSLNGISFNASLKEIIYKIYSAIKGQRDYLLLTNIIRCESHRWLLLRGISQKEIKK